MHRGNRYIARDRGAIVSTGYGLGKIIEVERKKLSGATIDMDFVVQILGKQVALRMKSKEFRKI